MAEIDGEQYAARKLGCEISADPLNPLDPIKKVCKSHHPDEDLSILDRAYRRAVIQHSAQRRKSGEPYIIHPLAVSQILADLGMGPIVVAAGLLHDTVEDTDYTLDQCRAEFGDTVAGLVDGVTKLSQLEVGDSAQAETIRKLVVAMSRDVRTLVVKLADRVHNARTWRYVKTTSAQKKARETLDVYAPLANRLGMNAIKTELEELSFKVLYPKIYNDYFASEPQIELASKLVKLAGAPEGSKVYFGNSGAEGNEAALKLAKLYGRTLPGALPSIGGKPARILAMTHGFHGRTMGALSATWKPGIRKPYDPLVPNIEFVRAGDKVALHDAFAQTGLGRYGKGPVAAVILELIQGEAGVQPLGADYVKFVRELCDINHALLIIDEVQTGIGRTGKWFAFQRDDLSGGVTPDMVTFAKGVAGGFPMGGMIAFGEKLAALFTPGSHGSTFAGNPLGAAAGLATLDVIEDENLVANAEARGKQLRDGITATGNPLFVSVRGRGLLDAVELKHPCSHAVMNYCLEHGLIVNAVAPNALRFAPPLIVTAQDVDQALAILKDVPTDLPND